MTKKVVVTIGTITQDVTSLTTTAAKIRLKTNQLKDKTRFELNPTAQHFLPGKASYRMKILKTI